MNRWLTAVVLGLTVVGCAAGVEDEQPGEKAIQPSKEPPAQTFAGDLDVPYDDVAAKGVNEGNGVPSLPEIPVDPSFRNPIPGDRAE